MVNIEPNITNIEALTLIQKLVKKYSTIEYDMSFNHVNYTKINRMEIFELVEDLRKLEKRIEWGI